VIAIFGPTTSGKTDIAEEVADRIGGELVSADAMQVYRGLPVLTNQSDFPTRLVAYLGLDQESSVADYQRRAHAAVDEILAAGRTPVVVGGTGLYLRAALAELDLRPPPDPEARERYARRLADEGVRRLHADLLARNPEAAAAIARTDRQRVLRALELLDAGEEPPGGPQLWTRETRHPTLLVALIMEREELYRRTDARVDAMVAAGAADEVRRADHAGASPSARQALGFEELLRGDVEAMKRRTRRYAKRQLTWLRKLPDTLTIDVGHRDARDAAQEVRSALRVAAASSSEPTKCENGPMNAQ
jgi:tRNA dimethylallyltransferase